MNAVQRYNERMTYRMHEASEAEVLMRQEAARLKRERSVDDDSMLGYRLIDEEVAQ